MSLRGKGSSEKEGFGRERGGPEGRSEGELKREEPEGSRGAEEGVG